MVEYEEGEAIDVTLHDGSQIVLRKLEKDFDPTNRAGALGMLEDANLRQELVTGLIYIDTEHESLFDVYNLPDEPLNRLPEERMRPSPESLEEINAEMF